MTNVVVKQAADKLHVAAQQIGFAPAQSAPLRLKEPAKDAGRGTQVQLLGRPGGRLVERGCQFGQPCTERGHCRIVGRADHCPMEKVRLLV